MRRPCLRHLAVTAALLCPALAGAEPLQVSEQPFRQSVLLTCELEAVHTTQVGSPRGLAGAASFTIAAMAEEGSVVRTGDAILRFDSGDLQQSMVQRETELVTVRNDIEIKRLDAASQEAELRGQIAEAEAALEKARIDAEIDPAITSASQLRDSQHEHERARVELERLRAKLTAARREAEADIAILRIQEETALEGLRQAEESLAAFTVTAPQDGILVYAEDWNDRKYQVGDSIYGGNTVLLIQDLGEMRAVCDLDQGDRVLVAPDQPVELRVDARPTSVFAGKVESIAPFAESPGRGWWEQSDVRVFKVRVALDRTDPELMKPGLTARADVIVRDETGLVLPRHAVGRDADGWYVRRDGQRVAIEVAARNAIEVLIAGGVAAGDRVEERP